MEPRETHSALAPTGLEAKHIARLFDAYFDVSALVFTLVIAAVGFALGKKPVLANEKKEPVLGVAGKRRAVTWATVATVTVLIGLLVGSVATGHAMAPAAGEHPVRIEVIGRKWWWEFRYPTSGPATRFRTAYELHIPVGRPVELALLASDVIHSFWVPALAGKRDAIPGKDRVLTLRADEPGVYEGQCAEFCGVQHANMRFVVVAESNAEFERWRAHQLEPANVPADPLRQRGLDVFMSSRCASCHAISGTDAFGTVGPDLTHVASRRRLAMGTIVNDAEHLRQWVADPGSVKPGVQMPGAPLAPADSKALQAYLGGLR